METIEYFSGVLLVSRRPAELAAFYRDTIGIPLEPEEHEGTHPHWGTTLGDIHFAIHPVEDFPDHRAGVGSVKLAFTVFDIAALAGRLVRAGVPLLYEIQDTGFFLTTAIQDPDGNLVEFTQLSDEWFHHLEERRKEGKYVVQAWRKSRK